MTQYPDQFAGRYAQPPSSAMAITALVLSCVGIVICGPVGLIGVVLGIIALVQAGAVPPRAGGKGMAIAAIAVGGTATLLSLITIPLLIGIMLPALGKARASALDLKTSANIRAMCQAVVVYSDSHSGAFPDNADTWEQTLVDSGYLTADMFVSPRSDGIGKDFFYVPGLTNNFDATQVVVYEDPSLDPDETLIGYADCHIENVPQAEALRILAGLTLPDGTPWTPHLDPSEQGP